MVFLLARVGSVIGLGYAMRFLPGGTACAVWVGVWASLTVAFGMVSGAESTRLVKVLLPCGLIGCLIGLTSVH